MSNYEVSNFEKAQCSTQDCARHSRVLGCSHFPAWCKDQTQLAKTLSRIGNSSISQGVSQQASNKAKQAKHNIFNRHHILTLSQLPYQPMWAVPFWQLMMIAWQSANAETMTIYAFSIRRHLLHVEGLSPWRKPCFSVLWNVSEWRSVTLAICDVWNTQNFTKQLGEPQDALAAQPKRFLEH